MSYVVVRRKRPFLRALVVFGLLLVIGGGGYGLFYAGEQKGFFETGAASLERTELREVRNRLEQQNTQLRETVAMLERSSQVDRQAFNEVSAHLRELQDELMEIRGEVAFYRGIVSPEDSASGLRLQSLRWRPNGNDRDWRMVLVLTQVLTNAQLIEGEVTIRVEGVQNNEAAVYPLNRLASNGSEKLSFSFRYYESIEEDITLPEGFVPQRAHVHIVPRGRNRSEISKSIDWMIEEG